jgi:hypothetical protein
MSNMLRVLFAASLVSLVGQLYQPSCDAQTSGRRPKVGFSIAEKPSERPPAGPLSKNVEAAFAAASAGGAVALQPFLAPDAELIMFIQGKDGKLAEVPFTTLVIQAATQACIGPYKYDEAPDWVQLSWVCRNDDGSPLAPFIKFEMSPELTLTVLFEGGLIKKIVAGEPVPIPRAPRVAMDSYPAMKAALDAASRSPH